MASSIASSVTGVLGAGTDPFREVTVPVAGTNSYDPLSRGTKFTRDPDLSPRLLLTSAGIVIWPLLVTVDAGMGLPYHNVNILTFS
jgi:hypothetical protein